MCCCDNEQDSSYVQGVRMFTTCLDTCELTFPHNRQSDKSIIEKDCAY